MPCLLQLDYSLRFLMPPQVLAQQVLGQQLLASKPQRGSFAVQLIICMLQSPRYMLNDNVAIHIQKNRFGVRLSILLRNSKGSPFPPLYILCFVAVLHV